MNKKKILFFINGLYGGGAEKVFQTLINHLEEEKYELTVYSLHEESIKRDIYKRPFTYRFIFQKEQGSKLRKFWIKIKNTLKMFVYKFASEKVFYKLFISGIYNVEASFIEGYATRIISGSPNEKSRKIAWVHIDLLENNWSDIAYRSQEEQVQCYHRFDKILCVSGAVGQSFVRKFGMQEKVETQYNPVDQSEILERSGEPIEEKFRPDTVKLVTIGRLVGQKGYDRLVKIINQLKEKYDNFECWILGEGDDRASLENYISQNDLKKYIKLLGFKKNPYPYLKQADLFVCSSRAEGFSTVATEAIILEKPIITTECAGMRELFGDSQCGIICPNNQEALCKALEDVLGDRNMLERFKQEASQRASHFKLEMRMKEVERLLDERTS